MLTDASALADLAITRAVFGAVSPLFTDVRRRGRSQAADPHEPLYNRLGSRWAPSLMAFLLLRA